MPHSLFYSDKTPFIKILGSYGGKSTNMQLTSLQLSKEIALDAGNLIEGLGNGVKNINHIFVTHSHLDHILDIPFVIDATFEIRKEPIKVYGRKGTLDSIKNHILNNEVWPDFTNIKLLGSNKNAIELVEIELDEVIEINDCKIKAIKNNHTDSSNAYVIEKENKAILFSSDTYSCDELWNEINSNKKITTIIMDVSFPSKLDKLALASKHLTPALLKEELKKLKRDDVTVHINHIKPFCKSEVVEEIIKEELLLNNGAILEAQDVIEF